MYKHILIPTDGSAIAEKAVAAGLEFAREANARVTLFTAVPAYHPPSEAEVMARRVVSLAEHTRRSEQTAQGVLGPAADQARGAGLEFQTDYAQSDHPWEAIIEAAKRHGCDAIFMGSHGRKGLAAMWHGSETQAVLTHSKIPTVVYR